MKSTSSINCSSNNISSVLMNSFWNEKNLLIIYGFGEQMVIFNSFLLRSTTYFILLAQITCALQYDNAYQKQKRLYKFRTPTLILKYLLTLQGMYQCTLFRIRIIHSLRTCLSFINAQPTIIHMKQKQQDQQQKQKHQQQLIKYKL